MRVDIQNIRHNGGKRVVMAHEKRTPKVRKKCKNQ
jgi:hypothetical protein